MLQAACRLPDKLAFLFEYVMPQDRIFDWRHNSSSWWVAVRILVV